MDKLEAVKAAQNLKAINPDALYRVELYNDPDAGKIEHHVPVDAQGNIDATRSPKFFSSITVNVDGQSIGASFEIKNATSLGQAIEMWPGHAILAGKLVAENLIGQRTREAFLAGGGLEVPS